MLTDYSDIAVLEIRIKMGLCDLIENWDCRNMGYMAIGENGGFKNRVWSVANCESNIIFGKW